jgi:hypothetical protein
MKPGAFKLWVNCIQHLYSPTEEEVRSADGGAPSGCTGREEEPSASSEEAPLLFAAGGGASRDASVV